MEVEDVAGAPSVVSPWFGPNWQHLLITDVDNTLFDFGLYAEAGLQAVVLEISKVLRISPSEAVVELRNAFRKYNSVEIPFAYEELLSLTKLPPHGRRETSARFARAFWWGASQQLIAYPGVLATMSHLSRNGTAIVAVTDAPMWEVWRKLKHLGALKYISGIAAVGSLTHRQKAILRHNDIPEYDRPSHTQGRFYKLLNDHDRKPNSGCYQYVLDQFALPKSSVTVLGDSPTKDLVPARELGLRAYWAAYGERNRHLEKMLQAVTPFEPPEAKQSQSHAARSFPLIKSFKELETIIDLPQMQLPLDSEVF